MRRLPVRPLLGGVLAALGALALFLGWYGVSGTPVTAKQVPYIVSGGLSGVCLLVLAAACFATDDVRRRLDRMDEVERKVDALYRLLTEEVPADDADAALVAVEGGTAYHRVQCRLVQGKPSARTVAPALAAELGLTACRVCDPPGLQAA